MEKFNFKPNTYFNYPVLGNNYNVYDLALGFNFNKTFGNFGTLGTTIFTNKFEEYDMNINYYNEFKNCNVSSGIFFKNNEEEGDYSLDFYTKSAYKFDNHTFSFGMRFVDFRSEDFEFEKNIDKTFGYHYSYNEFTFGVGFSQLHTGDTEHSSYINWNYDSAKLGFGLTSKNSKVNGGISVSMNYGDFGYGAQLDTDFVGGKLDYKYGSHTFLVEAQYNWRNSEQDKSGPGSNTPKVGALWSFDF